MRKNKGFTLIELLVVIAIIGILAAIVLVSLSGARTRARDARIQADMSQVRNAAELYASDHNSNYSNFENSADENTLNTDITTQGGGYVMRINTTGSGYCAATNVNKGNVWCVDSTLKSGADADNTLTACAAACVAANTCACD